jgi:hypothetical protein
MFRILFAMVLGIVALNLSAGDALAAQSWRNGDCAVTGIVLPEGRHGQCSIGPIEYEQGCRYETYAVGAGPTPGPRFRVEVKVGRDAARMCALQGPNTSARLKTMAGYYVEHMGIAFSELQSLDDGTLVTFFRTKDAAHDGDCVAFEKRERRQGVGYRSFLVGFFCGGPGVALDLDHARALLMDVHSTF